MLVPARRLSVHPTALGQIECIIRESSLNSVSGASEFKCSGTNLPEHRLCTCHCINLSVPRVLNRPIKAGAKHNSHFDWSMKTPDLNDLCPIRAP